MDAHDPNFWPVFLIVGIPVILLAGGAAWLVLLGFLALLAWSPWLAIALGALWLIRWLVLDFFLAFVAGLGGGLGLRASGFGRRRPRRQW